MEYQKDIEYSVGRDCRHGYFFPVCGIDRQGAQQHAILSLQSHIDFTTSLGDSLEHIYALAEIHTSNTDIIAIMRKYSSTVFTVNLLRGDTPSLSHGFRLIALIRINPSYLWQTVASCFNGLYRAISVVVKTVECDTTLVYSGIWIADTILIGNLAVVIGYIPLPLILKDAVVMVVMLIHGWVDHCSMYFPEASHGAVAHHIVNIRRIIEPVTRIRIIVLAFVFVHGRCFEETWGVGVNGFSLYLHHITL